MRNRKGANHVTNTFVVGSAWEHGSSLYNLHMSPSTLTETRVYDVTLHIKPAKYDSTSGTKTSKCLKTVGEWGCGSEQAPL